MEITHRMTPSPDSLQTVAELPVLPPRPADSNKGSFGKILVLAGSRGMSGAAILAATPALRGGAGLVRVATPAEIIPIVAGGNPCYTTLPLPADEDGTISATAFEHIFAAAEENDVMAAGPGLGRSAAVSRAGDLRGGRCDQACTDHFAAGCHKPVKWKWAARESFSLVS